jgi:hypothetical protein
MITGQCHNTGTPHVVPPVTIPPGYTTVYPSSNLYLGLKHNVLRTTVL